LNLELERRITTGDRTPVKFFDVYGAMSHPCQRI
jgi:hypothetical protein